MPTARGHGGSSPPRGIGGVMQILKELNENIDALQERHEKILRGKTQHHIHTSEILEESRLI